MPCLQSSSSQLCVSQQQQNQQQQKVSVSKGVWKVIGSGECECDLSSSRCLARLHSAIFSEPGTRAMGRMGGRWNPKIVVQCREPLLQKEEGKKRVSVGGVKDRVKVDIQNSL